MRKIILKLNKRGAAVEAVGAVFLIGLLVFGGLATSKILSENRYVGDSSTMKAYDLARCDISHVSKSNMINFKSLEDVPDGYALEKCL